MRGVAVYDGIVVYSSVTDQGVNVVGKGGWSYEGWYYQSYVTYQEVNVLG